MVLLDDDVYQETKDIVLGRRHKTPLLSELSDWFKSTYSVNVLNIQFSKLLPQTETYRLYVIIESTEDYQRMYVRPFCPNPEYQDQISHTFRELARKHGFADEPQLKSLFVIYNDFSEEAKTEANWNAAEEVERRLKSKYPAVWHVETPFSNAIVFYYHDTDIAMNESAGVSGAITEEYYSILKEHDELNCFTRENISLKFDSKENLDKNYQGSLFYYTR